MTVQNHHRCRMIEAVPRKYGTMSITSVAVAYPESDDGSLKIDVAR